MTRNSLKMLGPRRLARNCHLATGGAIRRPEPPKTDSVAGRAGRERSRRRHANDIAGRDGDRPDPPVAARVRHLDRVLEEDHRVVIGERHVAAAQPLGRIGDRLGEGRIRQRVDVARLRDVPVLYSARAVARLSLPSCPRAGVATLGWRQSRTGLSEHPDQHRPKPPVLLAIDEELGEGRAQSRPSMK